VRIAANRGSQAGVRRSRSTLNLRGQSVDSTTVVSRVAQPKKPPHTELKGLIELTGHVLREAWTSSSGFCRAAETRRRRSVDSKGLLAMWRWKGGERLLNLKGLLPVLPPSLERVFENGTILRPLFWCKIVPNSAISCQNKAECGKKSTFLATGFVGTCQTLRLGSHPNHPNGPNGRRTQIGRQAESITIPRTGFAGRGSQDFTSGSPVGY